MNQIIADIGHIRDTFLLSLGEFFAHSGTYVVIIIVIYFIVLVGLVFWYYSNKKTLSSMNRVFEKSMDDLYYQVSLILYREHQDIYDRDNTVKLLLKHKTEEIAKRTEANYYENFEKLLQEIVYIGELTNQEIIYDSKKLHEQYDLSKKLAGIVSRIASTLQGRSFGLSKFFLQTT